MDIVRHQFWEEALAIYLDRVAEEPFVWGKRDCALFAADCVNAMCGVDPAQAYRGKYDTAYGAAKALREYGAGTLLKTMRATFHKEVNIHFAQRGDVVMKDATTTGICVGRFCYFVGVEEGQVGLVPITTSSCRYAFRVPFELEGGL